MHSIQSSMCSSPYSVACCQWTAAFCLFLFFFLAKQNLLCLCPSWENYNVIFLVWLLFAQIDSQKIANFFTFIIMYTWVTFLFPSMCHLLAYNKVNFQVYVQHQLVMIVSNIYVGCIEFIHPLNLCNFSQ